MRSRYRWTEEHAPYFLTMTIVEWIPIFTKQKYFDVLIDSLKFCQKNKGLKIHAYVMLDNHVHVVASGERLADTIRDFKSFTAGKVIEVLKKDKRAWMLKELAFYKKRHKQDSEHQVWQEGSHPQAITVDGMLSQKIDYIHCNPVKRGLVREPEHWVYSSALDYSDNYSGDNGLIEIDFLE